MTPSLSVLRGKLLARRTTRRPSRTRLAVLASLVITAGIFAVYPAGALASALLHHAADGHSAESRLDTAGFLPLVLTLVVLTVVGFVGTRRRWRDAALLSLAGLLSVLTVEAAVHSVHHLDDPFAAQTCVVLASSGHVDGTCDTLPRDVGPTWTPYISPIIDGDVLSPLLWFRPDEGRSPPAALSR